jgi:glycosyltransferase involved in cell wall biosynthesis
MARCPIGASGPKEGLKVIARVKVAAIDRLVSVIVPAWNAAPTLAETLRSIARQSYRCLEILIIDDGSTDATAAIAAAFCAEDPRARQISKSNGGVASARNLGIAEARGDFVAPIDADDLWHPDHVASLLREALAAPVTPGFVFALSRHLDGNSRVIRSGGVPVATGSVLGQMAYRNIVGNGSAMLILRSAVLAAGGYDERLRAAGLEGCEDYLLQLQLAARHPVVIVPQWLVGYRLGDLTMSSNQERMYRSFQMAIALFLAQNGDIAIPRRVLRWQRASGVLVLAKWQARRRRLAGALASLVVAGWLDPLATCAAIHYDARRLGAKMMRWGARAPLELPAFDTLSPTLPVPDEEADGRRSPWLERIEAARLRWIDTQDLTPVARPLRSLSPEPVAVSA